MDESAEEERWQELLEEMEKKSAKDRKQQVLVGPGSVSSLAD